MRPWSEVTRHWPNLETSLAAEVPDDSPSLAAKKNQSLCILPIDVFKLRDVILSVATVALEVTPVVQELPACLDDKKEGVNAEFSRTGDQC